jgi:hypothetical protein
MMKREQMLQILAAADESKLAQACQVLGIDCGYAPGEEEGMSGHAHGEPLESWNQTRIAMPESKRQPLVNPRAYLKPEPQAQPMPRRMDYMPPEEESETEDYAAPPPMVRGF